MQTVNGKDYLEFVKKTQGTGLVYHSHTITYSVNDNQVYVNGAPSEIYKPAFVNENDSTQTLIGYIEVKTNKFISLSGKVHQVVAEDSILV